MEASPEKSESSSSIVTDAITTDAIATDAIATDSLGVEIAGPAAASSQGPSAKDDTGNAQRDQQAQLDKFQLDKAQLDKAQLDKKAKTNLNKLQKRLRRDTGRAIKDFGMIEEGDKVMVCLSGGKDSYTMLDILMNLQQHAPIHFELVAVNLDQKQPGFPEHVLPEYLSSINVPYHIVERDTYSVVKEVIPEGKTTCGLCSRMRRGTLYRFAQEIGATKIALGHHRDDILETLFLNMFYGGKLKSMPPKLKSDDGKNIVIRPLAYCREKDIARFAELREYPIIPCNLCGSQENLQRQVIKEMLQDWDKRFPGRIEVMFRSLQHVVPSHLVDTRLYDFAGLSLDDDDPRNPAATNEEGRESAPQTPQLLDILAL